MRSPSPEREQLDAAGGQWNPLPMLVTFPYLLAYLSLTLALTGSPRVTNGVFVVIFAVLLVGASVGPWRHRPPSPTVRGATLASSAALGLVVAVLVGHYGLA